MLLHLMQGFNPRTHEECDPTTPKDLFVSSQVSIHALTKSATDKPDEEVRRIKVSIHALTKSATPSISPPESQLRVSIHALTKSATGKSCHDSAQCRFQSTHSRRVRLPVGNRRPCYPYRFNPRTHEECDCTTAILPVLVPCFNPRTHEECDLHPNTGSTQQASFNPRTHEECD